MADIEAVILTTSVRLSSKVNGAQLATLDRKREGYDSLSFELTPFGVNVSYLGILRTLLPWPIVRQVVYVESPGKAAK